MPVFRSIKYMRVSNASARCKTRRRRTIRRRRVPEAQHVLYDATKVYDAFNIADIRVTPGGLNSRGNVLATSSRLISQRKSGTGAWLATTWTHMRSEYRKHNAHLHRIESVKNTYTNLFFKRRVRRRVSRRRFALRLFRRRNLEILPRVKSTYARRVKSYVALVYRLISLYATHNTRNYLLDKLHCSARRRRSASV